LFVWHSGQTIIRRETIIFFVFPRLQGALMGAYVCSVDFASQELRLLIFNQQQIDTGSFLRKPGLWIRRIRNGFASCIRIHYSDIKDPDPYYLSKIKEISEKSVTF
jgi:hypothetical protein